MREKKQSRRERKPDIRILLLSVLLVAALAVILLLCLKLRSVPDIPEDNTPARIGGGEPIPEDVNKEKDLSSTHLPGYSSMTFEAGKKEQTVVLQNPGENTCLVRVSLILEDGTVIYTSELIKPGYYSLPITLTAPMERGIYRDVTMQYDCFTDDEARTPLNGATCKLDITVK